MLRPIVAMVPRVGWPVVMIAMSMAACGNLGWCGRGQHRYGRGGVAMSGASMTKKEQQPGQKEQCTPENNQR